MKFKVGDILSSVRRPAYREVVLSIDKDRYNIEVLTTVKGYGNIVGTLDSFHKSVQEIVMQLDPVYLPLYVFNSDLQKLLK